MKKSLSLLVMLSCASYLYALEAYFTPSGDIKNRILTELRRERSSLHAALYIFTDKEIAQEIVKAKKRGVRVEVICDQSTFNSEWGKIPYLHEHEIPVYVYDGHNDDIMHHKFWVFSNNRVITGSYNPTKRASRNFENIVVIDDALIAQQYESAFQKTKQSCKRYDAKKSFWSSWNLREKFRDWADW
jgi:phosphatidylserine/phosphatidylglycerophosphate/cardiolipin synthase-like enzyme